MSLYIEIDSFSNSNGDYTIMYNHVLDGFRVDFADPFGDVGFADPGLLFMPSDRGGMNEGDLISTIAFGSDNVTFLASLTYPYATATHGTGGGGGGGGAPTCDLVIANVSTTNASASGVSDGAISIHATTTHVPIQYSIDNLTWQSSGIFTGLPGGSGTAYTKDDLGCTASMAYTVSTTPPPPPDVLVRIPASTTSRWSALFNPIVFGYQSLTHAPGRKFVTEITSGYDGATGVITATHAANLTGYCRADISKYLRILLKPKDQFDYSAINYRDSNISASYTVRYKEVWDGGESAWESITLPFYVTYSAMQIGNPTGGNMQPFVTQNTINQVNPAKFLNDFKKPRFYTDMPFDISFIYSEYIAGYQIKLGGNGIDINGNVTGALGELMLLNENGSVLLNNDGTKLLIEKQAPGVLYSKLGVNRLMITQNIPANSIWLDIFLFYVNTSGNVVKVTEDRRLTLDNSPCNGLPYEYIKWIGPTGGWLYYMFVKNQIHEINTSNAAISEIFIDDYTTADSSQQLISIDAQKAITMGANDLPAEEIEVLSSIVYSPKVYRLIDAATNTWQGVIVSTNSLKMYQTYGGVGDFEVKILLPQINTQKA
jgi:hypothetical protein